MSNRGPFIHVNICNPDDRDLNSSATFLLDSGADITYIKKEIFDILELIIEGDVEVEGIDESIECQTCYLTIEVSQLNISERLEVAIDVTDQNNLLGRDFLNKFGIYLDGPALEYTIRA